MTGNYYVEVDFHIRLKTRTKGKTKALYLQELEFDIYDS